MAADRPLTMAEYHRLVDQGIVESTVELMHGRIVMGRYRLVLSPEQARDARRLGVTAYSAVDAVLDDDEARAEVAVRLRVAARRRRIRRRSRVSGWKRRKSTSRRCADRAIASSSRCATPLAHFAAAAEGDGPIKLQHVGARRSDPVDREDVERDEHHRQPARWPMRRLADHESA